MSESYGNGQKFNPSQNPNPELIAIKVDMIDYVFETNT